MHSSVNHEPTPYMTDLAADFHDARLPVKSEVPKSFVGLHFYLGATEDIFGYTRRHALQPPENPRTETGEMVARLLMEETKYAPSSNLCCSNSEVRLVESISDTTIRSETKINPIIITDSDGPLGIVKSCGTKSFYGLRDNKQHGVLRAVIGELDMGFQLLDLPVSDAAWILDISTCGQVKHSRISAFAIDKLSRAPLRHAPVHENTKNYDHADIITRVDVLAATAEPVTRSQA